MKLSPLFIIVMFFLLICYACDGQSNGRSDVFNKIKTLEYSRHRDLSDWQALNESVQSADERIQLVKAIGKSGINELVPLLKNIFDRNAKDSIRAEVVIALGLIGSAEAQNVLLNLPFQTLSESIQTAIVRSLAGTTNKKALAFLEDKCQKKKFSDTGFKALGLSVKQKPDIAKNLNIKLDSLFFSNLSPEKTYYLLYAADFKHIPLMVDNQHRFSNPLLQKHLLRALLRLKEANSNRFLRIIQRDSLRLSKFQTSILNMLQSPESTWRSQYYALQLASSVADSLFLPALKSIQHKQNLYPHLFAPSLEALNQIVPESAVSNILNAIDLSSHPYLKALIINKLSRDHPKMGYRFVMQNLDRGDRIFKKSLLEALGNTKLPLAFKTLHQFTQVEDPLLVNTAFSALAENNAANATDLQNLFEKKHPACASKALNWLRLHDRKINEKRWFQLYREFNKPKHFEFQHSVISMALEQSLITNQEDFEILYEYSGHYRLKRMLVDNLPSFGPRNPDLHFELPGHLNIDSLRFFNENPVVALETNRGHITLELFADEAPLTVFNFIHLINNGFYFGSTFHRVIPDFVIQGGDPEGSGWGGPDFCIPSEHSALPFERGSIGMATSGFDTGGSQFFICQSEQPHLNRHYTVFGKVIEGMAAVDRILPGDKIIDINVISDTVY